MPKGKNRIRGRTSRKYAFSYCSHSYHRYIHTSRDQKVQAVRRLWTCAGPRPSGKPNLRGPSMWIKQINFKASRKRRYARSNPRAPNTETKKVRSWGVFRRLGVPSQKVFGALGKHVHLFVSSASCLLLRPIGQ